MTFHDQGNNLILAKAPSLTRQYIGSGKNKTEALRSAKRAMNHLIKKISKYKCKYPHKGASWHLVDAENMEAAKRKFTRGTTYKPSQVKCKRV